MWCKCDCKSLANGVGKWSSVSFSVNGAIRYKFSKVQLVVYYQLTAPENTITYHNAPCLSPQNFA